MKDKTFLFGIAVFLWALTNISIANAEAPALILSEIRCATGDGEKFIELLNNSDQCIPAQETKKYQLKKNGTDSINVLPAKDIPAKSYFLWEKSSSSSCDADTCTTATIVSNNTIGIFYNGNLIESISCDTSLKKGESLEKNTETNVWKISPNPTPEKSTGNSCPAKPPELASEPPASATPSTIRINEIFPNPEAKNDVGEFIELYNFGTEPADISDWILRDATKTGKYIFQTETSIAASGYFVVTDKDFKLSLNNSNETISLFDKNEKLVDSAHYEKTKEDVSLNYTSTGWRGGSPTPGIENQINNLPETREKVPKKGYHGVPVEFSAKGKDADNDTLKYTWDFGDGHKSYKEKTSHIYEKNGTYTVTLKTDDGREEMLQTFTIEIRSFAYQKIRITSFSPNPEGNDTDNEWLMLENKGKKSVNLKGFGIATGWKNLVNHPIREDFILEPKKETKLTREYSLFTLPNQKGKIELRAPDGKVLQKIKYKLEKSIAEEAVYKKKKGERWNLEEMTEEPDDANTETASSDSEEDNNEESLIAPNNTNASTPPEKEDEKENSDSQETESAVLGASTITETDEKISPIQYVRNKKWLALINNGTQVNVPENINFAPNDKEESKSQKSEHYAVSFVHKAFSEINTSLNNMFNASQN